MVKYALFLLGFSGPLATPKMIENEIEKFYEIEISEIKEIPSHKELVEPKRNRFKANKVLTYYQEKFQSPFIILTSRDIAMNKHGYYDWGILGYSIVGQKVSVISTKRIKSTSLLINITLHEVGHGLGLPHCKTYQACLMKDAAGKGKRIEMQGKRLCNSCKNRMVNLTRTHKKWFGLI